MGPMKIRIISVGRTEDDYIRRGTERFLKQVRLYHPVEEVRIKESRVGKQTDTSSALRRDAEKILKRLDARDRVILMDRQGSQMTSRRFATFLGKRLVLPARSLTFLVGGADGVAEAIVARADEVLSLSRMTFPHELSRLMLLEQLYRGFTILNGKRYHR